jgi:DNA-binding GntR family transcriptional regulator
MMILRHRTFQLSSRASLEQHRRILQLLKKNDREGAERLMVEHIRMVRDRLLAYLGQAERDGNNGL